LGDIILWGSKSKCRKQTGASEAHQFLSVLYHLIYRDTFMGTYFWCFISRATVPFQIVRASNGDAWVKAAHDGRCTPRAKLEHLYS